MLHRLEALSFQVLSWSDISYRGDMQFIHFKRPAFFGVGIRAFRVPVISARQANAARVVVAVATAAVGSSFGGEREGLRFPPTVM